MTDQGFRANRPGEPENWLNVVYGENDVEIRITNGPASLSPGQVSIMAREMLDWLGSEPRAHGVMSTDLARLVRLAEFVGEEVGADPYEYPAMNDPQLSAIGQVAEFLHQEGEGMSDIMFPLPLAFAGWIDDQGRRHSGVPTVRRITDLNGLVGYEGDTVWCSDDQQLVFFTHGRWVAPSLLDGDKEQG